MKIPLVDLKGQFEPFREEMLGAIARVIDAQQFVLGAEVRALEEEIARYSSTTHAIGCASGSDALLLALMAFDIKAGDEVITSPFTFFATGSAITRLGAHPVFVDIDPLTYNIDPERLEAAVSERTRAIIPVHMYGQCADMGPLIAIGERHQIPIIEDAAQAIGAEDRGRRAGSMGRIGCFSFYPTKNLGGAGDGGMLTTSDDGLAKRLGTLRVHGGITEYLHSEVGLNSRLDALQAVILRIKFRHLDDWSNARAAMARRYDALFAAASLPYAVITPFVGPESRHIFHQYVVRVPHHRDALMTHLNELRVGTKIYYPVPLHLQECFRYLGYRVGDFPESERAANETFAIPISPELTDEQQQYVVESFRSFTADKLRKL